MNKYCEAVIDHYSKDNAYGVLDNGDKIDIKSKYLKKSLHNDRVLIKIKNGYGYVQKIIKRHNHKIKGEIINKYDITFLIPWSKYYYTDFYISNNSKFSLKTNDIVEVEFKCWKKNEKKPCSEIVKIISKSNINQYLLYKLGLDYNFSNSVLDEVNQLSNIPHYNDNRIDLTNLNTFSIDDNDKIDNAFSVEKTEFGHRIYVHISDVPYYVKPGSKIDQEAFKRSFSIDIPGLNVPMLPDKINDLTSFKENFKRYAITLILNINKECEILDSHIVNSIINSKKVFTYKQAEDERNDVNSFWYLKLNTLYLISEKLKIKYFKNFLNIKKLETGFEWCFDSDNKPIKLKLKEKFLTHIIVENLLLLTNKIINDKVVDFKCDTWVYRVNDEMDNNKFECLKKELSQLNINVNKSEDLKAVIKNISKYEHKDIIIELLLEKMKHEKYSINKCGNNSLGISNYIEFTSPLSRYADILNHRILKNLLLNKKIYFSDLENNYKQINEKEKWVINIKKESNLILFKQLLNNINYLIDGKILKFTKKGILVRTEFYFNGLVSKDNFNAKWDKSKNRWINDFNWKIGDKIKVSINKNKWEKDQIYLDIL